MKKNLKKMISYYKPYRGVFFADMLFAIAASAVALAIPLIARYITSSIIYLEREEAVREILYLGVIMAGLVAISCFCNFFISNYGHVMGAKIEYDMRAEVFAHFQKLSFAFYDNQKVGALMARITTDLFDITELMHHGPENIVISLIKICVCDYDVYQSDVKGCGVCPCAGDVCLRLFFQWQDETGVSQESGKNSGH